MESGTKYMEITCINCPQGCRMKVTLEEGKVTAVEGNNCKRGETYAYQECVAPLRMVTAVIAVKNRTLPVSVKTAAPIPRAEIFNCMRELEAVSVEAPICMGQIILANVCGTGVDIIATKDVD